MDARTARLLIRSQPPPQRGPADPQPFRSFGEPPTGSRERVLNREALEIRERSRGTVPLDEHGFTDPGPPVPEGEGPGITTEQDAAGIETIDRVQQPLCNG